VVLTGIAMEMGSVETVFYGIQPFAGKNRHFVITRGKSVITSYKTLARKGDSRVLAG
jgi:hypothetical protein